MTFVLLVAPVFFGSDPAIRDNIFSGSSRVAGKQADNDHVSAASTLSEERDAVEKIGLSSTFIEMKNDPRGAVVYADHGDAVFANDSITFHNFTDKAGKIVRRVAILYPMSEHRRGELARVQVLNKLMAAAATGVIELVDLRPFEDEHRCLEGGGALNFSADGRVVYMSRSQRTDDEVLEIVCEPENLNIPKENRFVFSSSLSAASGAEASVIYHTSMVGWCGRGICAWGLQFINFDGEEEAERFYNHLEADYELVLQLNEAEVRGFAGNAVELIRRYEDDREIRVLCMSLMAMRSLQPKNLAAVNEWYGEENVLTFYSEVFERRAGASVRATMAVSITHGTALPADGERTTLDICGIVTRH